MCLFNYPARWANKLRANHTYILYLWMYLTDMLWLTYANICMVKKKGYFKRFFQEIPLIRINIFALKTTSDFFCMRIV